MSHNASCANATQPGCRCTGCGGAQHGWQGTFGIAADTSGEQLRKFADAREREWVDKPVTLTRRQAAVGCARADVISWLHRDTELLRHSISAAQPFAEDENEPQRASVLRDVENKLGEHELEAFQAWAVKAHFWCELLAQTAHALDQFRRQYERARRTVTDILLRLPGPGWPAQLDPEKVIRAAVSSFWTQVLPAIAKALGLGGGALTRLDDVFKLIWPIRILAIAMCPDPSKHRAVCQYCLDPVCTFATAQVRREVLERLFETFKARSADWFPQIAELLRGVPGGQDDGRPSRSFPR